MKSNPIAQTTIVVAAAAALVSGCVTSEGYKKEYMQTTGMDMTQPLGHPCPALQEARTSEAIRSATLACATEFSGKPFVNDNVMSLTELRGQQQLECFFGGYDRQLILDRIGKGVGLVQPILMYGKEGAISVDWVSTEKLIAQLRQRSKLNVRPVADSRRYFDLLMSAAVAAKTANAVNVVAAAFTNFGGPAQTNDHYVKVVSKFEGIDYVVAPSSEIVDDILTGRMDAVQRSFKDVQAAEKIADPARQSFKPADIQQLQDFTKLLEIMTRTNNEDVKLDYELVERMKAFNPSETGGLTQKSIARQMKRGCSMKDLSGRYSEAGIEASKAAAPSKGFLDGLKDMVEVDTSKGLEVSLSNRTNLIDTFVAARKRAIEMRSVYAQSTTERNVRVVDVLVPFSGRSFEAFRVTGFTRSQKL